MSMLNVSTSVLDDAKIAEDKAVFEGSVNISNILANQNSKVKDLPFDKVFVDRGFNIRDDDPTNYDPAAVEQLRLNLNTFGQNTPFMVSLQKNGDHLTLRGNLRYYCMLLDRLAHSAAVAQGHADPADMPWKTIKCDVKVGLTRDEEELLMLDHDGEKQLSPYEMFRGVKKLFDKGFSETQVQRHMGYTRGEVVNHYRALKLPSYVTDAYVSWLQESKKDKKDRDPNVLKVDGPTISALYAAQNKDEKYRKEVLKRPARMGEVGENFQKKWDEVNTVTGKGGKGHSPKQWLDDQEKRARDPKTGHHMLHSFINHALGMGEGNFAHLWANIIRALNEVYPAQGSVSLEPVVQYEGNVAKQLGHIPTYEGAIEPSFVVENQESETTESETTESEVQTQEPVAEEPVAEEPVAEEPVAEEPVTVGPENNGRKNRRR